MSTVATSGGSGGASEAAQVSLVFVTVPTKEVGKKIAHSLVEGKLAACVNLIPGDGCSRCHPPACQSC
jgi:periplasmic divalent cation tolerance protein